MRLQDKIGKMQLSRSLPDLFPWEKGGNQKQWLTLHCSCTCGPVYNLSLPRLDINPTTLEVLKCSPQQLLHYHTDVQKIWINMQLMQLLVPHCINVPTSKTLLCLKDISNS